MHAKNMGEVAQVLYEKAEAVGEATPDSRMAFIAGVGWAMQESTTLLDTLEMAKVAMMDVAHGSPVYGEPVRRAIKAIDAALQAAPHAPAGFALVPVQPTNKQIVLMAGAILQHETGTADTRHPYWARAVEQAEETYNAAIKYAPPAQATAAVAVPDGYALVSTDALRVWGVLEEVMAACVYPISAPAQDKCLCTFAQRMTGDGCRYCNPQEYIDRLHGSLDEYREEADAAAPAPAQERKPLTDEQIDLYVSAEMQECLDGAYADSGSARDRLTHFARAIDAAMVTQKEGRKA